jgi:hypothetical protein
MQLDSKPCANHALSRSAVTTIAMVAGNEKFITKIIDEDGLLKEWVGIGWIDIRTATKADRKKYPTLEQWK